MKKVISQQHVLDVVRRVSSRGDIGAMAVVHVLEHLGLIEIDRSGGRTNVTTVTSEEADIADRMAEVVALLRDNVISPVSLEMALAAKGLKIVSMT